MGKGERMNENRLRGILYEIFKQLADLNPGINFDSIEKDIDECFNDGGGK